MLRLIVLTLSVTLLVTSTGCTGQIDTNQCAGSAAGCADRGPLAAQGNQDLAHTDEHPNGLTREQNEIMINPALMNSPALASTYARIGADGIAQINAVVIRYEYASVGFNYTDYPAFVKAAFANAAQNKIHINIEQGPAFAYPAESADHNYAAVKMFYPNLSNEDLPRVWYYLKGYQQLVNDVSQAIIDSNTDFSRYDLFIVMTDAQYDSIAFLTAAADKHAIFQNTYAMSGWDLPSGGTRSVSSLYFAADETIHETGHFMRLDHACSQCNDAATQTQWQSCCNACQWRNDVMSYCRTRPMLSGDKFYNVYGACDMNNISTYFLPDYTGNQPLSYALVAPCNQ